MKMKEIKFRTWDGTILNYDPVIFGSHEMGECWVNISIRDEQKRSIIFEQYVGLKDKNGKEIYEGDIILFADYERDVVKYGMQEVDAFVGYGYNLWSFYNDEGNGYVANDKRLISSIEVVGNIHENPELLYF
jgi:uncharacterized phage protein (TIGR01671 family)